MAATSSGHARNSAHAGLAATAIRCQQLRRALLVRTSCLRDARAKGASPMSLHTPAPSVAETYVHRDKQITPAAPLELGGLRLKWYDVAPQQQPVERNVAALA